MSNIKMAEDIIKEKEDKGTVYVLEGYITGETHEKYMRRPKERKKPRKRKNKE